MGSVMATMMGAGRRARGRGMAMVMVDRGLGWRGAQAERDPDDRDGQRVPDGGDHALHHGSRGATHARNCFNTMGTRPGKSSLIRPGPNDSAQAAWIQAAAHAAS